MHEQIHTKMQQDCYKNKLTLGEKKIVNKHFKGYF